MTFKNRKASESEFMKSFEKIAFKKGMISTEPVVKKAEPLIKSTNNLTVDLLILAENLRARGMEKEAEILEAKIQNYKQAEHLYETSKETGEDLLDQAYPDGDVDIAPADSWYGKVLTPGNAQKEIIETIEKKPTGKTASLVRKVGRILEESLAKVGQDAAGGTKTQEPGPVLPQGESFLDSIDPKKKNKKGKIAKLNAYQTETWPKIAGHLGNALSVAALDNPDVYSFTLNRVLYDPSLYIKYAKDVKPEAIENLKVKLEAAFGSEPQTLDTILAKVLSATYNNKDAFIGWADSIHPGFGRKFFWGIANAKNDDPEEVKIKNDSSVFYVSSWIMDKVGLKEQSIKIYQPRAEAAAREIYNAAIGYKDQILSDAKLGAASQALRVDVTNKLNPVSVAHKYFSTVTEIPPTEDSVAKNIKGLIVAESSLSDLLPEGTAGAELMQILAQLNLSADAFKSSITGAVQEIKSAQNMFSENSLSESDKIILDPNPATALLGQALKHIENAISGYQNEPDSQTYKALASGGQQTYNVVNLINENKGQPFTELAPLLSAHGFKARNWPELIKECQEWLNEVVRFTSEVSKFGPPQPVNEANDGMVSTAAGPNWGGGATKPATPTSGAPASGGPVKGGTEENQAVKLMQDAMNSLAIILESFKNIPREKLQAMRNSGRGANTASGDGLWGPRTKAGLEAANQVLNLKLVTTRNPATVVKDAKSNQTILENTINTIKAKTSGGSPEDVKELDKIPRAIDWTSDPGGLLGQIPVSGIDLNSLGSLYDFLIKNNLEQPVQIAASELEIGQEGIKLGTLANCLMWFRKRAVAKYNLYKDQPEAKKAAEYYFNKVNGLFTQYKSLMAGLNPTLSGKTPAEVDGMVIPAASLRGMGKERAPNDPRGSGKPQGGSGFGRPGNLDGSGGSSGYSEDDGSPPFGETIDLRRIDYFTIPFTNLSTPVLDYLSFRDMNARNLAQKLFGGGKVTSKDQQFQALSTVGIASEYMRWNDQIQETELALNVGGQVKWLPVSQAMKFDAFNNKFPDLSKMLMFIKDRDPVSSFQKMLYGLQDDLKNASYNWISKVRPTDAERRALNAWHDKWINVINRKLGELQG